MLKNKLCTGVLQLSRILRLTTGLQAQGPYLWHGQVNVLHSWTKKLSSHSATLHQGAKMGTSEIVREAWSNAGLLSCDGPAIYSGIGGNSHTPSHFMYIKKTSISSGWMDNLASGTDLITQNL